MANRWRISLAIAATLIWSNAAAQPAHLVPWAVPFSFSLCSSKKFSTATIATAMYIHGLADYALETVRDEPGLLHIGIAFHAGDRLEIAGRLHGTPQQRLRLIYQSAHGDVTPGFFLQLAPDCQVNLARLLFRDVEGRPVRLVHLDANLEQTETDDLNPPVPAGTDPGGVAVAHVDSGVNYLLPLIAERLARNDTGHILGHDFTDDDARPFDLDPSQPAFFPIRHGTTVASVLIAEAPEARLIPLRHPGNHFSIFTDIVKHIAKGPARIVLMPLGGYKRPDWEGFAAEAKRHPELLFILSAGNNGRNIDEEPVYPASLRFGNAIVVTSSDAFGKIAQGSNWGTESVDIAVPGERLEVIDHRGAKGRASGSSYAAPRIAALAARLLALKPELTAAALKQAILDLASPLPRERSPRTRHGWIANPALEAQDP